jgi:NAD(P)-dependent dehydrogenase (short-subunit alcohol dehydrogenase family)
VATIRASTTALDVVIINAGILPFIGRIQDMPSKTFLATLETNTVGPHSLAQAFYPFLIASKADRRQLVFISR